MSILIIAEKNKAALAIAEALGPIKIIKNSKYLNIYYVFSKDIYVLPLRGHILEYKNSEEYKSWTKSDPREIITKPEAIKKYPKQYAGPYINALKEYSVKCKQCIIGTDADIEGCNIGLLDALPYVRSVNPNIIVSQLWLSSLQKGEISKKYQNLIKPKLSWADAGEARAILDAFIGFSATREITNTLKPLLREFNVNFTSIGRVQTSALYLIYLREKEIIDFIPEKYFTIEANLIAEKSIIRAYHKNNPFKSINIDKAKLIFNKIKNEKIALIENYNKNVVKRKPPSPLNTNKALILLTKNLKINASTALNIMNQLYLNKIISYPRTDSDVYKPDFPHREYIEMYKTHSEYGNYALELFNKNRFTPTRGKKDAGDHPPITPLESLESDNLKLTTNLHKKVYNILSRHYLALFGEDTEEFKQDLDLLIKEEPFKAQIVSLIKPGFMEIVPFLKPKYNNEININDNKIPIKIIELNDKETKPPPHYTDSTLLELMEKNGLGTKSTRPVIIQTMLKRKVIYKNANRFLISDLGTFLIENLITVWLPFLKPTFTREVETQLEMIKDEKKIMLEVVKGVKEDFMKLFDDFRTNKNKLFKLSKEYTSENNKKNRYTKKKFALSTSNCPFCKKKPMKFINLKGKRFLACSDDLCKNYLPLPKKGLLKLLDSKCSICDFNIFSVKIKKANNYYSYYMCPNCWREGLNNKSGKGFCSNCENFKIINNKCIKKEG